MSFTPCADNGARITGYALPEGRTAVCQQTVCEVASTSTAYDTVHGRAMPLRPDARPSSEVLNDATPGIAERADRVKPGWVFDRRGPVSTIILGDHRAYEIALNGSDGSTPEREGR